VKTCNASIQCIDNDSNDKKSTKQTTMFTLKDPSANFISCSNDLIILPFIKILYRILYH